MASSWIGALRITEVCRLSGLLIERICSEIGIEDRPVQSVWVTDSPILQIRTVCDPVFKNTRSMLTTFNYQVLLEIVGIRNLPVNEKGNVFVSFSKKKPDMFLHGSCHLSIFSETGDKQVAGFECEPTGDLIVTLATKSKPAKTIGSISISLDELMDPNAELSVDKWFELKRHSRQANSKPIYLHVAASFTVPVPSPQVFETLKLHPFSMNACRFPFPGVAQHMRSWAHFVDGYGNDIVSLQIRKSKETGGSMHPILKQNIFGMTKLSRNLHLLAEYVEDTWFFKDSNLSLTVQQNTNQEGYVLELKGVDQLKLFPGRKFEYQPKNAMLAKSENFMTVVEFSAENPYGKAIALFDLKSGLVKISEDWFVLPALVLSFILSSLLKKGGLITVVDSENLKAQDKSLSCTNEWGDKVNSFNAGACGGCGAGCGGSGCGTIAKSGGCGSGCGGGCGGSGCGNVFISNKSTGCGSGGCGGCGAAVNFDGAKQAPSEVTPVGA